MQRDPVITHERVLDHIIIEDRYEYSTYTTIGLANHGDFYIKLEFIDLDSNSITDVAKLYKAAKALKFHSNLAIKEAYKITHIVVEKMQANSDYSIIWECLSDDPGFSLIID